MREAVTDSKFHRAIRKYGSDLEWTVLYENVSLELLDIAEICAIYANNSFYDGYNCTLGGDGNLGRKLSEEHKNRISEANTGENHPLYGTAPWNKGLKGVQSAWNKGLSMSEEAKKKLSESRIGEKNYFYGKTHSAETKRKMSEARKKYWENRRNR